MIIRPKGNLTAANADEFRENLLALVESGATHLTVNLDDVDMIDSKGLAGLVICYQRLADNNGSLSVETGNRKLLNLFRVMRLDEHFTVRDTKY